MNRFLSNIILITLFINVFGFAGCDTQDLPDDMRNFQKNLYYDGVFLENLARISDSCTPRYTKNYAFFEKKSEIFFNKGLNNMRRDDLKAAVNDLLKSLESGETSMRLRDGATSDNLHYLGQINENIGDIYNKVNSLKPAAHFYSQAADCFEAAGRQHEVIEQLLKIGDIYQRNHIPNIALLNYETAESHRNLSETQLCEVLIKKGISLYDVADVETADSIYDLISRKSPQSIDYNYFTAIHLYNHDDLETALPELLHCFKYGTSDMKVRAAEMLADLYFRMGERYEELQYAQYQAKITSSEARLTPTKMELEEAYDDFIKNTGHVDETETGGRWWIMAASVLLLASAAASLILRFKKRETETNHEPVATDVTDEKETLADEIPGRSFDDDFRNFAASEIFSDIKGSLEGKTIMTKTVGDYPRLALSKTKIVTLTTRFNECFPNLTHTLSAMHPELTGTDFRYIILSIMGLSNLEIAVLLQQTYSSVSKRNRHLKDVFATEDPLEQFFYNYLHMVKY